LEGIQFFTLAQLH
jgi:hypothetical protein